MHEPNVVGEYHHHIEPFNRHTIADSRVKRLFLWQVLRRLTRHGDGERPFTLYLFRFCNCRGYGRHDSL